MHFYIEPSINAAAVLKLPYTATVKSACLIGLQILYYSNPTGVSQCQGLKWSKTFLKWSKMYTWGRVYPSSLFQPKFTKSLKVLELDCAHLKYRSVRPPTYLSAYFQGKFNFHGSFWAYFQFQPPREDVSDNKYSFFTH